MSKAEKYRADLEEAKSRLELYIQQEKKMLTDGVQSYGIGSRSLTRYNTDLAQIRDAIKELKKEVEELEGLLTGNKSRKCVGIIPRF